jgi:23S rRNA pseudouridine1911/1915/1917 synthase
MEEHRITHQVTGLEGRGPRLDVLVTEHLGLFPRSQLKQRVTGWWINGQPAKPSRKVKNGDRIEIAYTDPPPLRLEPESMDLDILYEDADVIVINKPRGLVVHPGAGNQKHTLANGLLAHCSGLDQVFATQPLRPGIVHRLDKETSGVIIAAKHPEALESVSRQFRLRQTRKLYLALVAGKPEERSGRIDTYIARDRAHRQRFIALAGRDGQPDLIRRERAGEEKRIRRTEGKQAVTDYKVLREYSSCSLVALKPHTGRTHQLRVHMKHLGCPILGDMIYAKGKTAEGPLMLHAYKLKIRLPDTGHAVVFKAPLPADFKNRLKKSGDEGTPRLK